MGPARRARRPLARLTSASRPAGIGGATGGHGLGETCGFSEEAQVDESQVPAGTGEDGVTAVLYGIFTSFTEALDGFDQRLAAIEAALRAGPGDVARRLDGIEQAVARVVEAGAGPGPSGTEASLAELAGAARRQAEMLDQRTAALSAAVEELRTLLQAHVDETSHSLGRRAGEAGRRLASELGLRGRPRSDPSAPE